MNKKFEENPVTVGNFESVDIKTMAEMTDDEYRDFLFNGFNLLHVDHHGVLRSCKTGRPFATNPQQLDLLIEYLQSERSNIGED
jgi:hypothetical protein